jgi:hypothetical protein
MMTWSLRIVFEIMGGFFFKKKYIIYIIFNNLISKINFKKLKNIF